MHENTIKVIHWIWGEPKLADFLRGIAAGEKIPPHDDAFEYGDDALAEWVSDFVMPEDRSRGIAAWERMATKDWETRVRALYEELTEGRKTPRGRLRWIGEVEWNVVRDALLGAEGDSEIYVHATAKGFHPNNRYRVSSRGIVYERGWTSASGSWGLAEADRQVCPKPDEVKCGCTVVQRER